MMICCVCPLNGFAAESSGGNNSNNYGSYNDFRTGYGFSSGNYEFLCKYHIFRSATNEEYYFTSGLSIPQNQLSEYVDSALMDGSVFDIHFKKTVYFFVGWYYGSLQCNGNWNFSISRLTFDTVSNTLNLYNESNNLITQDFFTGEQFSPLIIDDFTTNFEEFEMPSALSLSVAFNPTLSGQVTRKTDINGNSYTSDILELHVTNNGENAQFSFFIVPKGQNVSFPSAILNDNQGFTGSPVYAYVTDEWTGFSIAGLQSNRVYAPSAWHTVPAGYTNQIYRVPWEHMKLYKDTQYDVVVYGCLNSLSGLTESTGLNPSRPVDSDLSTVQEIYRSSFTITDPAVYNPEAEGFGDHPWNPNEDHTDFWKSSSAFVDSNGNVVIRGNSSSSGGYSITGDLFNSKNVTSNANSIFRDYFSFLNSALSFFPPIFLSLISIGLSGMIIIGIIKVVLH